MAHPAGRTWQSRAERYAQWRDSERIDPLELRPFRALDLPELPAPRRTTSVRGHQARTRALLAWRMLDVQARHVDKHGPRAYPLRDRVSWGLLALLAACFDERRHDVAKRAQALLELVSRR